jgi:ADP-glucose pyrophosphorylase
MKPHYLRTDYIRPTELYQASMRIYVFNRQVFIDVLVKDHDDFGKHII